MAFLAVPVGDVLQGCCLVLAQRRYNTTVVLYMIDILINRHFLRFLDIQKELLGVASNLGSRPGSNVVLDLLPVLAVDTQCYTRYVRY